MSITKQIQYEHRCDYCKKAEISTSEQMLPGWKERKCACLLCLDCLQANVFPSTLPMESVVVILDYKELTFLINMMKSNRASAGPLFDRLKWHQQNRIQ